VTGIVDDDLVSDDLVSVIIPVFNRAHLIGDAVDSVLAQHGANFEIVIVNDGSTDATGQVIDDLAQQHPHITAIHQPNRGPAAARNAAVAASNGPWITFLDSDDTMPTDRLANQLGAIAPADKPADQPAIVIGKQTIDVAPGVDPPPTTLLGLRGTDSSHYIMSMMTRRSTLDAVGVFDKQFEPGEDLELLFRMRRLGVNIIVSDQVWTHRRILGDNLSHDVEATRRVLFRAIQANRPRPGDTRPQVSSP
jgi:glycosyltransferase involved in cell wall biosynthesis